MKKLSVINRFCRAKLRYDSMSDSEVLQVFLDFKNQYSFSIQNLSMFFGKSQSSIYSYLNGNSRIPFLIFLAIC